VIAKRKAVALLMILVAVAMVLPSLAEEVQGKFGGIMRIACSAEPPTLDYTCTGAFVTKVIGSHIFEGLFTYNGDYRLIPQLADTYEVSEDGLTVVVRLRQGVLFHNLKEMTAEDVKASFERVMAVGYRKRDLSCIGSVEIVDKYTVQFNLSGRTSTFLELTATEPRVPIMPSEVVACVPPCLGESGGMPVSDLIGTGPYKFVEWNSGSHVKLERFEEYVADTRLQITGFGGERIAYLEEIYFLFVPEEGARIAGLKTGDYDIAVDLSGTAIADLDGTPGLSPLIIKPLWIPAVFPNTSMPPFDDVTFREAVNIGIDVGEILLLAALDPRLMSLDPSMYFEQQAWHNLAGAEHFNVADVETAKQLIKETGYAGEEIVLVTNMDYPFMYRTSVVLQSQMVERLGLNVKLQLYDWPTQVSLLTPDKWSQWNMWQSAISLRFDPSQWNNAFLCGIADAGYCNQYVDDLLTQGMQQGSFEERYETYSELQRYLYEEEFYPILLGHLYRLDGVSDRVKGCRGWYGQLLWNVWLED